MKDVMLWLGAGQIGMAIARRVGFNQKIIVGDKNVDNANNIAKIMREAGFFYYMFRFLNRWRSNGKLFLWGT